MKKIFFVLFAFLTFQLNAQQSHPEQFKSQLFKSAKNDIQIYYNPVLDKYDLHFLKLDLEVSDKSTYISGSATLEAKAVKQLDTLLFDFSNYMTVDSVFINNQKVNFSHTNNTIRYIFNPAITVNENIKAQIYYHGTPYQYGGGVTHTYDSNWGKDVTWTLSESFHAYEWWPCKQVLSDKIDSAYIYLTCDNECMAGSNGLLTNVVNVAGNKKRFEWKTYYPINYYLISFAVAEYQDYSLYAYPEGYDSILIQNFIYNTSDCLQQNKSSIDNTADFIELFSEKFGLYPFANEKYGHCLTKLGGGMEHQTMTTLGNFGYTLVAHELGHMWFGDYVTCATWQDIWINEGFASYSEYVALENLQSASSAREWINTAMNYALEEPYGSLYIPFVQANNEGRIFNYKLSYKKGATLLHMLRYHINNDSIFFASIRQYLNEFADSVATGDDFINSMENSSGIELKDFFNQWYYGKGYPRFDVDYTLQNDTLYLTVTQSTSSSTTPLFKTFVDYKISYPGGDTTVRLFQSANIENFKIPFKKQITYITVDADNWILNSKGTIDSIDSPENNSNLFKIYPNPANDNLNLLFNTKLFDAEKTISIYTINGQLLRTFSTKSESYIANVSEIPNGIYFIRIESAGYSYTHKFAKQ